MPESTPSIGRLGPHVIQTSLIEETMEFIWGCLIPWREDPDRQPKEGEEELNAQFHNFLQSQASQTFPMVLFQHEQRQEGRRRVDLSAKPINRAIIEGVTYTKYDPILVIEGKRLPAPSKSREREYVTGGEECSGGIQRFKMGLHGRHHETAIILGYLQKGNLNEWHTRINDWISDLSRLEQDVWSNHEKLGASMIDDEGKARTESVHPRDPDCKTPEIRIMHFWIDLTYHLTPNQP
jgi:hypothetical protein